MTKAEMTEIFSIMMLAWPQAKMFQPETLRQTVELWAACTQDIRFEFAQKAALALCQTSKFPPSIADFREQAQNEIYKYLSEENHKDFEERVIAFLEDNKKLSSGLLMEIEDRKESL